MKISAAGRYAVRLMVDIAKNQDVVALKEVAQNQNISLKYAEQIIRKLLKNDLLLSVRGQEGGYKLKHSAKNISVYQILVATNDVQELNCYSKNCPNIKNCVGVDVWSNLNDRINNYLKSVTLKALLNAKK